MAQLRFMNQWQFVKFGENHADLCVNLAAVMMNLVVRLLNKLVILLFLLFTILLSLGRQTLHLIEFIILIHDFVIHFLQLFHKLVEVLLDFFHFLYFFPSYWFLTHLRRRDEWLYILLLGVGHATSQQTLTLMPSIFTFAPNLLQYLVFPNFFTAHCASILDG